MSNNAARVLTATVLAAACAATVFTAGLPGARAASARTTTTATASDTGTTDAKIVNRPLPAPPGLFSGEYNSANARDVLMDIAKSTHLNAVIPADLDGTISAHFDRMPVMKAFAFVAGQANADYRVDDDTITVIKRAVVVRPRIAPSESTEEASVERAARQIDEEDGGLYRPRASSAGAAPVRVETYINIQTTPAAPAYPAPASPYAYTGYGYGGFGGYGGWGGYGGFTIPLGPSASITPIPSVVYYAPSYGRTYNRPYGGARHHIRNRR